MAKAKLFDEEVHKDEKLSRTQIARILANLAGEIEDTLQEFQKDAKKIEGSRKIQGDPISLSGISILDEFDELEILKEKFETPVSKEKVKAFTVGAPVTKAGKKLLVDLERIPEGEDRSKSIIEVSTHDTPNNGGPP